jgi:hypothetical protein
MPTPPAPRIIDARGLLPPEPMELTLGALDELEPDGEIHLLLYREPAPLYGILERNGYSHDTRRDADGTVTVRIRHAGAGRSS